MQLPVTAIKSMSIPVTAEEKTNKKNDVKAKSLLLMALSNEHQLTFSQYPDAKSMFAAIGNTIGESLDSIFNRLQKINTHVVVWMNKPEVETISIDDLYNNFKIVKQKVKKFVGTSSGAQNLAFMTASSTSSTNDANTASPQVSTASPNVNAASKFMKMIWNSNGFEVAALSAKWSVTTVISQDTLPGSVEHQEARKVLIWSDMAEEQSSAKWTLMAFSDLEVYTDKTFSKTCLKNYETLKKQCDDLIVKLNQTEFTATTYKRGLATVEEQLITYRKIEVLFSKEVAVLKREVACLNTIEIYVLKESVKKVKQEKKMAFEFKLRNLIRPQKTPNKLDLSYSGLDEFKEPEFKGYGPENSEQESNIVCDKKSDNSKENFEESLIEEQVSQDTSSFVESSPNVDKETIFPVNKKIKCDNHQRKGIVSRNNYKKVDAKTTHPSVHRNMSPRAVLLKTGLTPLNIVRPVNTAHPNQQFIVPRVVNTTRSFIGHVNTVRVKGGEPQPDDKGFVDSGCSRHMTGNIAYLSDFKEFDGGYIAFGGGAYGGRKVLMMCDKKNYVLFTDTECLVLSPNFKLPDENQILLKIPRKDNMYSFDIKSIVPKESFTCLVEKATLDESMLWHRRLGHINFKNINKLVKDNLVRGLPTKSFENDQSCVAFLNGKQCRASCKFDGKSDEGFFVGYSLSSKAFRANEPQIGLFDIDSSPKSMNSVQLTGRYKFFFNDSKGTIKSEISQDCIVMPIWKDTSYFDSPTKDVENGEPKTTDDAQKQVEDSPNNENAEQDKFEDDSSTKDVNAAGQHVNTASPDVNTGSLKLNAVGPSVNTASSNEQDSPKDMFTMGASHTLEATHIEFFSDEDEPEVNLGNITNSYTIEPTSIAKALSDFIGVEAMQDELTAFQTSTGSGYLWICLLERGPLEQNGSSDNKKALERGIVIQAISKIVFSLCLFYGFSGISNGSEKMCFYMELLMGRSSLLHLTTSDLRITATSKSKFLKGGMALYGLHQAPEWELRFFVDGTFIFGSTNKELCTGFEKLMKDKFQMSSIGVRPWYLGISNLNWLLTQDSDYAGATKDKEVQPLDVLNIAAASCKLLWTSTLDSKPIAGLCVQFHATAKVQTVNVVRQLHALVDKKRVIVTESSIRRDLHLEMQKKVESFKDQREYLVLLKIAIQTGEDIEDIDAMFMFLAKVDEKMNIIKALTLKFFTTTAAITTATTRKGPKDRGVVVPSQRKDQIVLDEQIARDIQAKLDAKLLEEQKLARKQEEEANIALIESWENTQAMVEADNCLAERLQQRKERIDR
ncbi:putative ribonuclease H-like domain-containing protein [Tanacetum coccineum]|uniref:Ribonuclease H-like domain-containing protein n=1 Tax=Tanacetum coccineum TaxID=301880 RepID=A0ABQ4YQM2_9ASTR